MAVGNRSQKRIKQRGVGGGACVGCSVSERLVYQRVSPCRRRMLFIKRPVPPTKSKTMQAASKTSSPLAVLCVRVSSFAWCSRRRRENRSEGRLHASAPHRSSPPMSAGCATPYVLPSGWQQSDIADGAITDIRLPALQNLPFRLSLPINRPTRPPPLILGFHGWGGSHEEFETHRQHGRQHGYIVASPMGYSGGTGHASWNGAADEAQAQPVRFASIRTRHFPTCAIRSRALAAAPIRAGGRRATTRSILCGASSRSSMPQSALTRRPSLPQANRMAESSRTSSLHRASPLLCRLPSDHWLAPPRVQPPAIHHSDAILWNLGRHRPTVPAIANPHAAMHPGDPEVALDTAYAPAGGWLYVASIAVVRLWAASNGCDNAILSPPPCNSEACRVALDAGAQSCVGWTVGCDANATVIRCLHPGGHTVPVWAPQAHWAYMQQVMAREGGTRSSSTLSPPPPPPQRQYPSLPLPLPPPGAPLSTAPVAPLYLVIVVGTIVAFIVFALGVLFGKCQGRKGRQKVVTTATRSKPGAGMEMTSVAPDSGLKTGDGIVDGARVVD